MAAVLLTTSCLGNLGRGALTGQGALNGAAGASSLLANQGSLRLLTNDQYRNTIRDVFGSAVTITPLDPDLDLNGFASIGSTQVGMAPGAQDLYLAAADSVATQVTAAATRAPFSCQPTGAQDANCATTIVKDTGRLLWRRPLTDAEVARYVAVWAAQPTSDFFSELEPALRGLLASPYFLYRVEVGHPDAQNPNVFALDNFEIASRLSYLIWNSTPDDALLDAAANGELTQDDGLATSLERLLADPRAMTGLGNFFTELYQLDSMSSLDKTLTAYPGFTTAVESSLGQAIALTIDDVVLAEGADARNLFTSPTTYVNSALAAYYGFASPSVSGWQSVQFPASQKRTGIMGQPGIMALFAHPTDTSPTERGEFIRVALMCESIPPPPPNVDTTLAPNDPNHPVTARDRMDAHRSVPSCASCHSLMDPLGMAYEDFDGTGLYRTTDDGLTLDLSGNLDGANFADGLALAQLLHDNPATTQCMVQKLVQYTLARGLTSDEAQILANLQSDFAQQNYSFRDLVRSLVKSRAFQR